MYQFADDKWRLPLASLLMVEVVRKCSASAVIGPDQHGFEYR
jgi:hypothetical protein